MFIWELLLLFNAFFSPQGIPAGKIQEKLKNRQAISALSPQKVAGCANGNEENNIHGTQTRQRMQLAQCPQKIFSPEAWCRLCNEQRGPGKKWFCGPLFRKISCASIKKESLFNAGKFFRETHHGNADKNSVVPCPLPCCHGRFGRAGVEERRRAEGGGKGFPHALREDCRHPRLRRAGGCAGGAGALAQGAGSAAGAGRVDAQREPHCQTHCPETRGTGRGRSLGG